MRITQMNGGYWAEAEWQVLSESRPTLLPRRSENGRSRPSGRFPLLAVVHLPKALSKQSTNRRFLKCAAEHPQSSPLFRLPRATRLELLRRPEFSADEA